MLIIRAMTLIEWRKSQGLTQQDLADALDVTQSAVSQWEHGDSLPSGRLAAAIVELTQGQVSLNDLYPLKKGAA